MPPIPPRSHTGAERASAPTGSRRQPPQSDLDLRLGQPTVDGDRATVEWSATMSDAQCGPPREDAAVTWPGCLILRFTDEGLCVELREYWNVEFGRRVPAAVGWGG